MATSESVPTGTENELRQYFAAAQIQGRQCMETGMKNLLVRTALSFVLAASSVQASVAAAATDQSITAAATAEQKIQRFRPDEVAVLFVMGQSNNAGLNGLPADFVVSGASGTGSNHGHPCVEAPQPPFYGCARRPGGMMYLGLKQILATGKKQRILGLEWNQWEAEAVPQNSAGNVTTIRRAPENYANLFSSFFGTVGSEFPVMFVKPLSVAFDNFPTPVPPYAPAAHASLH